MSAQEGVHMSEDVYRLIYRSRDLIPDGDRKAELGRLFSAARSNNKKQQVTGALLVNDSWFVQILEGDEDVVRALYQRIEKDPRHDTVTVLDVRTVEERTFARWAMARVSEHDEPDIPLIAHVDGISPASSRGTTDAQEKLLEVMREAARGEPAPV